MLRCFCCFFFFFQEKAGGAAFTKGFLNILLHVHMKPTTVILLEPFINNARNARVRFLTQGMNFNCSTEKSVL